MSLHCISRPHSRHHPHGLPGSGKTTLLKRVLHEAHGQKIAIIENEFGEEDIDTSILVTETKEQIIR